MKTTVKTSLVQWLRLWAPTAAGVGSIPGQWTKISHTVQCGQKRKKKGSCPCFPLLPPNWPWCTLVWPCVARHSLCSWDLRVTNILFNGYYLLICWPHLIYTVIKPNGAPYPSTLPDLLFLEFLHNSNNVPFFPTNAMLLSWNLFYSIL